MTKSIYEQLPLSSIPTSSEVVWSDTGKVGFTHSGGTITRTGSAGWGLSKMQSDKTFTVGEGIIQIDFSTLGAFASGSLMLGLNSGTLGYYYSGTPYNPADFSIYMAGGDQVEVYENQVKKYGSGGGRNNLDKFRITIDNSGIVRYFCQPLGQGLYDLHYTSTVIASGTYFIQTNAYTGSSPSGICSSSEQTLPPLKQRFVETFSGDALDTDRWTVTTDTSLSAQMSDSVDGGYDMIAGTGTNNGGHIGFNNIRQYAHNGSVFICVSKVSNVSSIHQTPRGLSESARGDSAGNNISVWSASTVSSQSNFFCRTATSDGTQTDTASTIPIDTSWHSFRIENNGSSCDAQIDGLTEITHTTKLPTSKMQPICGIQNGSSGSSVTHSIRYMEAYNT